MIRMLRTCTKTRAVEVAQAFQPAVLRHEKQTRKSALQLFVQTLNHLLASGNVTERDYIAGFNYYITENNVKLQVNYLRKTFSNSLVPSRHLLLVNLQTSW